MEQKLNKNNKQYEDLINKYRENPESYGEDSDKEYERHDDIIDADPSITWDNVNKKFKWPVAVRGRKKTGRFEQVDHIFLVWFLLSLMLIQALVIYITMLFMMSSLNPVICCL
jgi:hypothetical protein